MEKVENDSPATKAIRQRMEEVRHELDEDVQEIVEGARDMGEWRTYVRAYPWVGLGAALVAGYWLVPRRHVQLRPDADTLAELANQSRLLAITQPTPPTISVRNKILAFAGNLVLRGVLSYVGQKANKLLATHNVNSRPENRS